MREVKRYDPINNDGTCGMCVEDADYGAYVEYADYAALEAQCKILRNSLAGSNNQARANKLEAEKFAIDWLKVLEERDALAAENARLRVKLMAIASAEPARHGIEWAKAHAAEGNNEIYAKWREAIDEARALAAENAQMRNSMLRLVTTHCAAAIKGQAADAELEQYLAAGIAQLEGQRDKLAGELAAIRERHAIARRVVDRIGQLCTTPHESKERFIRRVQSVIEWEAQAINGAKPLSAEALQ